MPTDADLRRRLESVLGATFPMPALSGRLPVLMLAPAAGSTLDAGIAPLVTMAQKAGIAVLLAGDASLARTLRADGVHLDRSDDPLAAYAEARELLGSRGIVGVDAGVSRHDAMTLGEAGADYLGFGMSVDDADPDADTLDERAAARRERVAWWSEIFEVPAVAFDTADPADAAELAKLGADFIGLRLPDGIEPAGLADWFGGYLNALDTTAPAMT